jgi:tRNA modification GTPase
VSGPRVRTLAARMLPNVRLRARYVQYTTIYDERGTAIDRGVSIFAPAPHSYTGEDTLELQVHGSPVVAREVVRALIACGARLAEPGEFTRRAFMHGKMDLHAAAAVADLIEAETRSSARAIVEDCSGAVDFPEEVPDPDRELVLSELDGVIEALERLQRDGEVGRLVREGITVAIIGPPNAGKSSLLNALLGEERAIVSEIAGTTRDTIEESMTIGGVRVRLVDTAGIREHADRLETAGIERSRRALESARITLIVIDGSRPFGPDALALLERTASRPRIVFFNKLDIGDEGVRGTVISGAVSGSVRELATIQALRTAIARVGWNGEAPDLERPHLASMREFDAVARAGGALEAARASLREGQPVDLIVGDRRRGGRGNRQRCLRKILHRKIGGRMLSALARNWWAVLLRGIAALIFGLLALLWPGLAGIALVLLFGAYAFVDGIFSLVASIRAAESHERWIAFAIEGLIGLIIAAITFFDPLITAIALYWLIAIWAVLTGIFELVAAVQLRALVPQEFLLIIGGLTSVAFGILMVVFPRFGALAVIWLIGFYAILFGVILITFSFRLRKHLQPLPH